MSDPIANACRMLCCGVECRAERANAEFPDRAIAQICHASNHSSTVRTVLRAILEPSAAMLRASERALSPLAAKEAMMAAIIEHNDLQAIKMRLRWQAMVGELLK